MLKNLFNRVAQKRVPRYLNLQGYDAFATGFTKYGTAPHILGTAGLALSAYAILAIGRGDYAGALTTAWTTAAFTLSSIITFPEGTYKHLIDWSVFPKESVIDTNPRSAGLPLSPRQARVINIERNAHLGFAGLWAIGSALDFTSIIAEKNPSCILLSLTLFPLHLWRSYRFNKVAKGEWVITEPPKDRKQEYLGQKEKRPETVPGARPI